MSARVVSLRSAGRLARAGHIQGHREDGGSLSEPRGFHYWTGISGRRYVHSIYSLRELPPVGPANYVLAHRDADGTLAVLAMGKVQDACETLNLAQIRRQGAELGANEVHVHLLGVRDRERARIEFDMRARVAESVARDLAQQPTLN